MPGLVAILVLAGATVLTVGWVLPGGGRHEPPLTVTAGPLPVLPRQPPGPASPAAAPRAAPVSLRIPALGLTSGLLVLGQQPDGSLAVPPRGPHYDQAGWYRYSPAPGAVGPAVIVGHVDSQSGGPSVFYRLAELRPRDRVLVTAADGSVVVFAVDVVRRFAKTAFPTRLVYGNTAGPELRLITCAGAFDRRTGHYLDNVVVSASLVAGT